MKISRRQFLQSLGAVCLVPKAAVGVLAERQTDIHSPSVAFRDIGKSIAKGYKQGIRARQPDFFDVVVTLGLNGHSVAKRKRDAWIEQNGEPLLKNPYSPSVDKVYQEWEKPTQGLPDGFYTFGHPSYHVTNDDRLLVSFDCGTTWHNERFLLKPMF